MGVPELLIVGGIVVVLFGATLLPRLARGFADAIRELREVAPDD